MRALLAHALRCAVLLSVALFSAVSFSAVSFGAESFGGGAEPLTRVDEEIVVSAHRMEVPVDQVGTSITVIDRQQIERRHSTTVLELLRTVPGLEVSQSGGPGQLSSVFVRGGNSSHTLVLLDGVRLNDNTTGAFDFSQLSVDQLERIEILRGPQSALYGSEAVAGVISLISRRGRGEPELTFEAEVGSEDHSRARASAVGASGRVDYAVEAGWIETLGLSAANEDAGNSEADAWTNTTASGRLGVELSERTRLDASVRYADGDADIDGFAFGVGPVDDNGRQLREQTVARLGVTHDVTRRWRQTVAVSTADDELIGEDPDNVFSRFTIESTSTEIMTQADLRFGDLDAADASKTLSVGAELDEREARNVGSFEQSLDIFSLFANYVWSPATDVYVSLGARHDDHEIFGQETTYRASLSWQLANATRLLASYGTGFKAPTFNELYFPGFGNVDLEAETSRGFDVGIEQNLADGALQLSATYFDLSFDDLILFTFPGGFMNVAEAETDGVELGLRWQIAEPASLSLTYTRTNSEDLGSGAQLPRRPKDRATADLWWQWSDRFDTTLTVMSVAGRVETDGEPLDDYVRADLAVSYEVTDQLRPYIRIRNLFDEAYEEVRGYGAPGVLAVVGVRLSF